MKPPLRALITGIQGFTGYYLAEELRSNGYQVFGAELEGREEEGIFAADLGDAASLRRVVERVKPHVVAHLAGIAFVGHGDAGEFYRVNTVGTRNLLEALASAHLDLKCVLIASSANVYGNGVGGMLAEDTPFNPANDYAVSKVAMEYLARLWMGRLPIVLTRPFNYTGVGQSESFLIPKIVAHFRRRAPVIELGNLDVWRDFSDVRAVVGAYRRLIEAAPVGQAVNVCSGTTHSLREVIATAENLTGHRIEVQVNPAFVRDNEVRTLCGDAGLLKTLVGEWETPQLRDTLGWMLAVPGQ
ncbi:MAG: GDP-mannose 4,6-dehydratase [Rhodocyclaceae bacterium]|nr:GDP-mannose 4,6-dehydratase [Rhodocyclaceae bacterium]